MRAPSRSTKATTAMARHRRRRVQVAGASAHSPRLAPLAPRSRYSTVSSSGVYLQYHHANPVLTSSRFKSRPWGRITPRIAHQNVAPRLRGCVDAPTRDSRHSVPFQRFR